MIDPKNYSVGYVNAVKNEVEILMHDPKYNIKKFRLDGNIKNYLRLIGKYRSKGYIPTTEYIVSEAVEISKIASRQLDALGESAVQNLSELVNEMKKNEMQTRRR